MSRAENTGMAFGFFHGMNIVLIFVVLAIITALLLVSRRIIEYGGAPARSCLVLIIGGALGNLIDRIFYGRITDFIELGAGNLRIPTFNVADSCITTGGILLAISFLFTKQDAAKDLRKE